MCDARLEAARDWAQRVIHDTGLGLVGKAQSNAASVLLRQIVRECYRVNRGFRSRNQWACVMDCGHRIVVNDPQRPERAVCYLCHPEPDPAGVQLDLIDWLHNGGIA